VARSRHCNARIRVPCNHLAPSLREGLAEGQTGEVRAMNTTDKPDGVNPKDLPNRPTLTEGQMIPEGNQSKKRIVEVYVRPSREHPDGIYALRMDYRLAVATGRAGLHAVRVKEHFYYRAPESGSIYKLTAMEVASFGAGMLDPRGQDYNEWACRCGTIIRRPYRAMLQALEAGVDVPRPEARRGQARAGRYMSPPGTIESHVPAPAELPSGPEAMIPKGSGSRGSGQGDGPSNENRLERQVKTS